MSKPNDEEPPFISTRLLGIHLHVFANLNSVDSADRFKWVYTYIVPLDPDVRFLYVKGMAPAENIENFGSITKTLTIAPKVYGNEGGSLQSKLLQTIIRKYLPQSVAIIQKDTYGKSNPDRPILFITQEGGPGAASIGGDSGIDVILKVPVKKCLFINVKEKTTCYVPKVQALQISIAVIRDVGCNHLGWRKGYPWIWWNWAWSNCGKKTIIESDDVVTTMAFGSVQVFSLWKNRYELFAMHPCSENNAQKIYFIHYIDAITSPRYDQSPIYQYDSQSDNTGQKIVWRMVGSHKKTDQCVGTLPPLPLGGSSEKVLPLPKRSDTTPPLRRNHPIHQSHPSTGNRHKPKNTIRCDNLKNEARQRTNFGL